jgi:exodeoxyribonuclease VIII
MMIDLETLGVIPGCPILSVGAVMFNPRSGVLGDTFYVVADQDQAVYGFKSEPRTLEWWSRQSEEARAVFDYPARVSIKDMLALFSTWFKERNDSIVWGNGGDFDPPILAKAYAMVGYPIPWMPYNVRCYRTIKNLRPDVKIKRHGSEHNALADAIAQAVHLMDIVEQSTLTLA